LSKSPRRKGRYVAPLVIFALLLAGASAVPVLADSPPAQPPATRLPEATASPATPLPTGEEMTETLAHFKSEEEAELAALESPVALAERESSGDLYSELTATESEELLTSQFAQQLQTLEAEPARFLSDATLERPLGDTSAVVSDEGHRALIEGTEPLQAPNEEGTPEKIDLSLEPMPGGGFELANPLVPLSIPGKAGEGLEVGEEGLQVAPVVSGEESVGRPLNELNAFYPEVQNDSDLLVAPIADGVELFDQLRSEESPEVLRFQLQLPAGSSLRTAGEGAEVVNAEGSAIAEILPPTATDAQGRSVPVQMLVEGTAVVLDVTQPEGAYAYPILVDPIVQEAYWANWNAGANLQLLEDGAWHWNTSEGPGSSYVYGSTSCIYTCWGSHRGLYMDTPNGNLPANRWGQWSYSAPNSETYLSEAWVSPLWRDDHVNCPDSKYAQPYDYIGMWNESSWNRILYNESTKNNDQGGAPLESWGRALIIGMGTSSGISIPCWRDIMAGGTAIWLEDWSRPELTTSSSGQWMDSAPIRLNASAYDAGLGVQKFKATATNSSGATEEWWTNNSCTGLYEAPCPHTWNLGEASQPQLSYSPAHLPEGIDKLSVTAYDALEKPSFTTNEMTVRIDHAPPTVTFSGTLTEQATLGTERPNYTVRIEARDGNPTSEAPSEARSGVTSLSVETNGKLVAPSYVPPCAGQPNCGAFEEFEVPTSEMTPGGHELRVKTTDAYGHVGTNERYYETKKDQTGPALTVTGLPVAASPVSYSSSFGSKGTGNGQFEHPSDIVLDAKGDRFVLDGGAAHIVQKFNENGEYLSQFGTYGKGNGQFTAGAEALAIDPKGNVWITDTSNNRVEEFNEKGEYVRQLGSGGTGNGQFSGPWGIVSDPKGDVWVSDLGNDRLQEFNEKGEFIKAVGLNGSGTGEFLAPKGVALGPGNTVWVADSGNNRVDEFSESGSFIRQFGSKGSGQGQLSNPGAVVVDGNGDVWVADIGNNRVEEFGETGTYLNQFGAPGSGAGQFSLSQDCGIAVAPSGDIWVTDPGNHRVQKWVMRGPSYSSAFGSKGTGNGQFEHPSDIVLDAKGDRFVLDGGAAHIVQKFNENGEYLSQFGTYGKGNGQFTGNAGALAVDPKGNVWVADTEYDRVEEFNESGEYLRQFGSAGSGNGQFAGTPGIVVDEKDDVWVSDQGNGRLQEFNEKGEFKRAVGSKGSGPGELTGPRGIALGPGENIWVADTGNNRVEEFTESGTFVRQFGTKGSGQGQLSNPGALAVDGNGNVWVVDVGNNRIEEFGEAGEYLNQFGVAGSGAGQFALSQPSGITLTPTGNVWVTDPGNHRVQEWAIGTIGVGAGLGKLTAKATDKGLGVTSLALKLTNLAGETENLEKSEQQCLKGACALARAFEADLSEKAPGTYRLSVVAIDGAGNASTASRVISVDPGPPSISLSGTLAERNGLPLEAASAELLIKGSESGLPDSGVKTVNVELDHQRVASYPADCSRDCHEVHASFHYSAARDGAERSIQATPTPTGSTSTGLNDVSCASAADCQAVGYVQNSSGTFLTLAEHWNGATWQIEESKNPAGALESKLEGISCVVATDCTAVGFYKTGAEAMATLAEHWNGTAWSIVTSPNPAGAARAYLYDISCVASNSCSAVGKSAPKVSEESEGKKPAALIEHWNGSLWTISTPVTALQQLRRISCASTTSCVAVSGLETFMVERWNGTTWSQQTAAAPSVGSATTFVDVSCPLESACTMVGHITINGHAASLIEQWNGTSWTTRSSPEPVGIVEGVTASRLEAVSCNTAESCTAVGSTTSPNETQPLVEASAGTEWSLEPAAIPSGTVTAALTTVSCTGGFDCTSAGSHVTSGTQALIESEIADIGDQTLTVEAVDKYGDSESRSISVDVHEAPGETPECGGEATIVAPKGIKSPSEAIASIEKSLPTAVAASKPTMEEVSGIEIDPSYSAPKPNLESEGSLVEGETSVAPEGGFVLKGVACVSPAITTSAATEAKVVDGDSAVFANTAPEMSTAIRPSAAGTTVVQSIGGSNAPTILSWNVSLNPGEKLVELASGAVAITRPEGEERTGKISEVEKPESAELPQSLDDAADQIENDHYQLIRAQSETTEEVVAVIAKPWVILAQGGILPLKIEVQPDVAVPTEYTMTYEYPPFELNFTPAAVVTEATGGEPVATASSVIDHGCHGVASPCGSFEYGAAANYAEYYGTEPHDRNNHYHDFGDDNCTNFISQILSRGQMSFMLNGQNETSQHYEAWWYNAGEGHGKGPNEHYSYSWPLADIVPRHLWWYGLVNIDSSNEPNGWTSGDILAEDWFGTEGKGNFNHLQYVDGTYSEGESREPTVSNESDPGHNYGHLRWRFVKLRIEEQEGHEWTRVPLMVKAADANADEPLAGRTPQNLYTEGGEYGH
jgi:tripartite motif-containing protein 71